MKRLLMQNNMGEKFPSNTNENQERNPAHWRLDEILKKGEDVMKKIRQEDEKKFESEKEK